jgi:hypothetical protein
VYVIPPGTFMAITAGVVTLTPRSQESGQHLAVNFFMRSLAEERKSGAIGVILSGTGTSMIGKSQRETEIPLDSVERVLRVGDKLVLRTVLDPKTRPTQWQRGQTSICGNNVE